MEVPILVTPPMYNPIDPDKNPIMGGSSLVGQTRQTLTVTDLVCEGPIQGLVDGASSIFLNDDRAVPNSESQLSVSNGPITVGLVNGSTTATISSNAPDDLIAESTGGPRSLLVKQAAGPISVTLSRLSGAQRGMPSNAREISVVGGASSILESFISVQAGRYNPERYVAVRLEPTVADAESLKIPTLGWLNYTQSGKTSGDVSTARFFPGSAKVNSGYEIETGSYNLFVDRFVGISSITNKVLTLETAWNGATGSYDFDVNGGIAPAFDPANSLQGSLLTTYGGVQTQFRTGTRDQTSFTGQGGVGSTAISNTPSAGAIEWTTGYGGAQAPKELIGGSASGFNLTSSQILELDEARISWQYGALYSMDSEAKEKHNTVVYRVQLAIKRLGESDFDPAFDVHEKLRHHAKSKNAVSFNIVTEMKQYQPMADFKFIISRRTDHENDGHDSNGVQSSELTTNVSAATISNTTGVIKENLNHPYSAMAKVSFSSKEFQNMPKRSYHLRGSLVRVPSNYVTREELGSNQATYNRDSNGIVQNTYQDWDGSFRPTLVYTNNPAWVFYDILINNRYGLGDFLSKSDIDIYQLYRIGRYCDELVPDGKGGHEPRFTCNLYLTKQADAFKVLKDMLTTFRGLLYFIDGKITPIQDAPSGPVYNFSKSNVIDGAFKYEGTGSKTRINQVVVSWNNPDNNYKLEPLLVEDRVNIAKTGKIISQDSSAFGCASEGQALRYGRWKLWTAANQTEIVSFATGLNGAYLRPGDIVNVQDADKNNVRYSGRIGSNVETGLTVSHTQDEGQILSNGLGFDAVDRADNVVMAGEAILPSSFSQDECLMEYGGTGSGMWVGVRQIASEYKFVFRSGDGDPLVTATDGNTIIGEIPVDEIPEFDGGAHTIVWEIQPSAGKGYLWIDGRLIFSLSTTDSSALSLSTWAGSNVGGWGSGFGGIAGNYAATSWSGDLLSDLRVYNDQIASDKITLDSPVTLNADSTYELSIVFVTPRAFLAQDTATINSVTYNRGDLIERAYIDANGDGTYTFQNIDSEADSINAKETQTGTDALLLSWSDYTSVEKRDVSTVAGVTSILRVSTAFSMLPSPSYIWVLAETDNSGNKVASSAKLYKILAVSEKEKNTYEITGVAHYNEKFSAIETDFTTYVADPVLPRVIATDIVPKVENFYASVTETSVGQNVNLFWEPPSSLGTSTVVAESDAPSTDNTQTIVDGGVSTYYEFLAGFEIYHTIEGLYSPIKVGKDARSFSLPNIPVGEFSFAIRAVNSLDNRSQATLLNTSITTNFSANVGRFAHGAPFGGQLDVGGFIDLSGLFQLEDYKYTMNPGGNANSTTNTLPTDVLWKQDCSDMPVISYTQGTGNIFDASLSYILFDASDSSDRLKLLKLYEGTSNEDTYWYDSGTGNGSRFSSNLTGTIIKPLGRPVVSGTGTSFTTELEIDDPLFREDGQFLGRVRYIVSDTQLWLDTALAISASNVNFKIPNIRIDAVNDRIISSVYQTSEGFFHNPFAFIGTDIKTKAEPPNNGLAYHWPSNSINDTSMTETVEGVHGVANGTAPTVSADSPVGNSLVNEDGVLLLSDSEANALETGGFSASYWFKSTSSTTNAFARLLTRDQNNHWAMGVGQNQAADGVQNLLIWAVGTGERATLVDVVTLNKWHHVGIVYDETNFKVFLDGEEVFNKTGYSPVTANARPIVFGVNTEAAPQSTNKFVGQFTEIKLFDKPLTNGEIRGLYQVPGATVAGTSDIPVELGTGTSVLKLNSEGLFLGNTTFADAPFSVDMAGNLVAASGSFEGDVIADSLFANTEIVAPFLKVGKVEDNSIGVDALREEVFKEIEERLGTSGGYYGVFETGVTDSTDGYLGETSFTKEITNGGAGFEHEGETTYLTFTLHDQFSANRDVSQSGREVNDLKLDVTLQKAVAGTSTWTDIGSTQRFTLDTNLIPYATQYTADFSIQSNLSTSGSHVVGTSYIYRVLLEAVPQADSDNRSMFRLYDSQDDESGANNAGGSPILLEIREGAAGQVTQISELEVDDLNIQTTSTDVATTSATVVDSFALATFRTARYTVQITQGTDYQCSDLMVIHDGSTAIATEYAMLDTGGVLGTFDVAIASTNVELSVTMSSADAATVKVVRNSIIV